MYHSGDLQVFYYYAHVGSCCRRLQSATAARTSRVVLGARNIFLRLLFSAIFTLHFLQINKFLLLFVSVACIFSLLFFNEGGKRTKVMY